MNTVNNRQTSVWTNNMNHGLNRWRSGSTTGFYVRTMFTGSVGVSHFRSAFLYNLNGNEPFAVSTGENAGLNTPVYNGHSRPTSGQRGHWITARGYSGYGPSTGNMTGSFADPMWTLQTGVSKFFSTNLTTFYSRHVEGRGIVW